MPPSFRGVSSHLPPLEVYPSFPDHHAGFGGNRDFNTSPYAISGAMTSSMVPSSTSYPHDSFHPTMSDVLEGLSAGPNKFSGHASVSGPNEFNGSAHLDDLPYNGNNPHPDVPDQHGLYDPDGWPFQGVPDTLDPVFTLANQPLNQISQGGHEVQYGSDPQFGQGHFHAPLHQPTEVRLHDAISRQMRSLHPQDSAGNTRAPTPSAEGQAPQTPFDQMDNIDSAPQASEGEDHASRFEESSQSPPRRSRAKTPKKGKDVAHNSASKPATRDRKPRGRKHINLSGPQKDANHRISEQRRRDMIKVHYDALKKTIPGMQTQKTKADELEYVLKWMRTTIEENERLSRYLKVVNNSN
ncbi:MAG: hypothetical protein Q9166_001359 [cf. Caloplaca sp. 2 TL-2023]